MATPLQNRLVGAVVLTALGVLFLPELLDGKKATVEENFATIPLRPVVEPTRIPDEAFEPIEQAVPLASNETDPESNVETVASKPKPAATVEAKAAPAAKTKIVAKSEPKTEPQTKAKPKATTIEPKQQSGWTVRLGAFGDAGNVNRLVKKLRANGYTTFTVPRQPVSGQLTVVYVGPEIKQARAKQMQQQLAAQLGLNGQVKKYNPLNM